MLKALGVQKSLDEARNGELHELLARAAEAIAGRAKAGDVAVHQQFADDGVQGADVAQLELFAFHLLGVAGLGVAAQFDAAAGVDLRDAEGHDFAAQRRRLAGRADQARVRNRQPQNRHQPLEVVVADQMRSSSFTPQAGRSRGKLIVWGPTL